MSCSHTDNTTGGTIPTQCPYMTTAWWWATPSMQCSVRPRCPSHGPDETVQPMLRSSSALAISVPRPLKWRYPPTELPVRGRLVPLERAGGRLGRSSRRRRSRRAPPKSSPHRDTTSHWCASHRSLMATSDHQAPSLASSGARCRCQPWCTGCCSSVTQSSWSSDSARTYSSRHAPACL